MIERFRVQNFKALRDVTLDLTPIHVLIGPNDSGKTSILEAMAALCRSASLELPKAFPGNWTDQELVWREALDTIVSFTASFEPKAELRGAIDAMEYRLACRFGHFPGFRGRNIEVAGETVRYDVEDNRYSLERQSSASRTRTGVSLSHRFKEMGGFESKLPMSREDWPHGSLVAEELRGAQLFRLNPQSLAIPVALDATRKFQIDVSGFGLALCLDDILGFERDRFTRIEQDLCGYFPDLTSIQLVRCPAYRSLAEVTASTPILKEAEGKGIRFRFVDSDRSIPASQASDGAMIILAYLTILRLPHPPSILLLEEPENGVHPKRLESIVKMLRELVEGQSHTQVVLTTHSPYVVDLFKPEEVTLCTKGPDGAVSVRRLSESEKVREQMRLFTLGEIWGAEGDEALANEKAAKQEAEG
jgi:predicted ATPase